MNIRQYLSMTSAETTQFVICKPDKETVICRFAQKLSDPVDEWMKTFLHYEIFCIAPVDRTTLKVYAHIDK